MKKIIIMGLVIIISITGCSSTKPISLEEFYGELINKPFKEISMDKVKKSLKNFEYEYELYEYSKEEASEYEEDLEINDLSDNKFKDENGSFINIMFDETNKEVSGILYSKIENDTTTNMICSDYFPIVMMWGNNIKKQKNIIDNLKLYEDLKQIVDSYFEAVINLYNKEEMTVDDLKSILKIDYEKIEDEEQYDDEETSQYLFVSDFGEEAYIEAKTKGTKVKDIDLKIYLGEKANYSLNLSVTNESIFDKEQPFRLETNISANLSEDLVDESGNIKEGVFNPENIKLFNLIFKGKDTNFYTENYNEESEKEIPLLEIKFDKNKDVNSIHFVNKRAVNEDDKPYDVDKTFKIKLKKGELVKVEIEMDSGKNLSIPIVITLQDLSNGEYIYSKSVDNTNENIFTSEKVDKDGEYEISVGMSDLDKYKFKVLAVKE